MCFKQAANHILYLGYFSNDSNQYTLHTDGVIVKNYMNRVCIGTLNVSLQSAMKVRKHLSILSSELETRGNIKHVWGKCQ